jgi:hypothetical protein
LTKPYPINAGSAPPGSLPVPQQAPAAGPSPTLTATVTTATLAAVSGLAGAAVTFAAGKSMLEDSLGLHPRGAAAGIISSAIDAAYQTLQTRAILAIVAAVILAALAIAVRGGRTAVRIALTVWLVVAAGAWLLNLRDSGVPGPIRGIDAVAVFFCLAAIVLAWLPSSRRPAGGPAAQRF